MRNSIDGTLSVKTAYNATVLRWCRCSRFWAMSWLYYYPSRLPLQNFPIDVPHLKLFSARFISSFSLLFMFAVCHVFRTIISYSDWLVNSERWNATVCIPLYSRHIHWYWYYRGSEKGVYDSERKTFICIEQPQTSSSARTVRRAYIRYSCVYKNKSSFVWCVCVSGLCSVHIVVIARDKLIAWAAKTIIIIIWQNTTNRSH